MIDGITDLESTNSGRLVIGRVDDKFFAERIGLTKNSTEDYVEGYVSELFTKATHYTDDPFSPGNKAYHSDGFHISKYFVVLTEHKRGKLSPQKFSAATAQAIYYYWDSLRDPKNTSDRLKYIAICDAYGMHVFKISDIKEGISDLFRIYSELKTGKSKLTASTVGSLINVDFIVKTKIIGKDRYYNYDYFSEGILWMFNEWEKDYPEELELTTKLS